MMDWMLEHSLLCLLTLAALGTVFWVWRQRRRLDLRLHWVLLPCGAFSLFFHTALLPYSIGI